MIKSLLWALLFLLINSRANAVEKNIDSNYEFKIARQLIMYGKPADLPFDSTFLRFTLRNQHLKDAINPILIYVHETIHKLNSISPDGLFFNYYVGSNTIIQIRKPNSIIKTSTINYLHDNLYLISAPSLNIKDNNNRQNIDGDFGLIDELSAVTQECLFLEKIAPIIDTMRYLNNDNSYSNFLLAEQNLQRSYFKLNILINAYEKYVNKITNSSVENEQIRLWHRLNLIFMTSLEHLEKKFVPKWQAKYQKLSHMKFDSPYESELSTLTSVYKKEVANK